MLIHQKGPSVWEKHLDSKTSPPPATGFRILEHARRLLLLASGFNPHMVAYQYLDSHADGIESEFFDIRSDTSDVGHSSVHFAKEFSSHFPENAAPALRTMFSAGFQSSDHQQIRQTPP